MTIRANERLKPVLGIALLAALALFAIASLGAPQSEGFASSEVQFTDNSARGMQIVPASCPSSPHWAGECGGTPPPPSENGCTISVNPPGITAGTAGTPGVGAGGFGDPGDTAGESSVLSWDTLTRAGYVPVGSISPGIGPVARTGSLTVSPSQTTIYTYSGTYNARSFGGVLFPVATFSCSTSLLVYSGPTPCGGYFCTGTRLYHRTPSGRTCVNTLISECPYGCSVDNINGGGVGQGGAFDNKRPNGSSLGCLPPPAPTGALSARPLLVRGGSTSNITWSADFVNSCTVTGTNGDRWETRTGNETSGPITQQTIYTLSCEGVDGSTLTQRVTVNIIPIFQEASAARAYSAAAEAPLAQAQSNDELRTTIRTALTADPRSASLSEAEMDAMVSALAVEAQMQGVTASDIAWRPESSGSDRGWWNMSACGNPSGFLCAISTAFGFAGPDPVIAIALGVLAAILLFVVGSLIEIHRRRRALGVRSSAALDSLYS